MKSWRDTNAIYQIYPRSFMDANGDGIGDLRGVIDRLDYLSGENDSLGVDAIWFSPFYPSPLADFGYDISDYCDIHPDFGTLDDFRELLEKAHGRGIKVLLDFVPNHTSSQHPWFLESKSSKSNPKREYYVWRKADKGKDAPNNWVSIFGGGAWELDETTGEYYLHTFYKEQPDLNWDNPEVREEMKRVLRFWLDIGVDGFRADAVRWLSKDPLFRDDPPLETNLSHEANTSNEFDRLLHKYSRFGKNLFPYLRELTDVLKEYDNRIMIFEDYPDGNFSTREQYLGFYSIDPDVAAPFIFEGMWTEFSATSFSQFVSDFQGMMAPENIPIYCFGNHDNSRLVSRYGSEQARLIAFMQMSLPGVPVFYYGDELGMADVPIPVENQFDQRDPERTPMQWDDSPHAGFTSGTPWLPVHDDVSAVNVARQLKQPDSFLALYRRLLRFRRELEVLRKGKYETFGDENPDVMSYALRLDDEHVYVALNFTDREQRIILPHGGRTLCCTHPVDYPEISQDGEIHLRPYEGVLVECTEHPVIQKSME